jgi:5-methylcytosine-specific restriction endonuclease McrA
VAFVDESLPLANMLVKKRRRVHVSINGERDSDPQSIVSLAVRNSDPFMDTPGTLAHLIPYSGVECASTSCRWQGMKLNWARWQAYNTFEGW